MALTFEREPDSAIAAAIEGDVHQTMVSRELDGGGIAGIASRAERDVFLNGRPARLGYLGQLRTGLRGHRVGALLDEGFAFCRTLHERGDVPAYLTAIVEGNHAARRLLCGLRSPAAPRFVRAGDLVTLAIPSGRQRALHAPLTGVRLKPDATDIRASRFAGVQSSSCRTSWPVSKGTAAATSSRRAGRWTISCRSGGRPGSSLVILSSRFPEGRWPAVPRRGISADSSRRSSVAIRDGWRDGGAW